MICSICCKPHQTFRPLRNFKCPSCMERGVQMDKLACELCIERCMAISNTCPYCKTVCNDDVPIHVIRTCTGQMMYRMRTARESCGNRIASYVMYGHMILQRLRAGIRDGICCLGFNQCMSLWILGSFFFYVGYTAAYQEYPACRHTLHFFLGTLLSVSTMIFVVSFCEVHHSHPSIRCAYAVAFSIVSSMYIITQSWAVHNCTIDLSYFLLVFVLFPFCATFNVHCTIQCCRDRKIYPMR